MRPIRILTVCTANVCRSPMMAALLRSRLDDRFVVTSAGVRAWTGAGLDAVVAGELERFGVRIDPHLARDLTDTDLEQSDLIVTATRDHRSQVVTRRPAALRQTFTLREFAALTRLARIEGALDRPAELVAWAARNRSGGPESVDIDDPFQQGPEENRRVAEQIDGATAVVARALLDAAGPPGEGVGG